MASQFDGVITDRLIDPLGAADIAVADLSAASGFTQAAFVADADDTSTTTLAADIDELRDSLIAAGIMAAS